MKKKSPDHLGKRVPSLIVKHGNTGSNCLTLDRQATVLGRSLGCDIELNASEISNVHCVISWGAEGLHLRDCKSRVGTRLNGVMVEESPLHDTDILHIGPFSFEVRIPEGSQPNAVPPAEVEAAPRPTDEVEQTATLEIIHPRLPHLDQSRRRFAKLALKLRHKLREREPETIIFPIENGAAEVKREQGERSRRRLVKLALSLRSRLQCLRKILAENGQETTERELELERQTQHLHRRTMELEGREEALQRQQQELVKQTAATSQTEEQFNRGRELLTTEVTAFEETLKAMTRELKQRQFRLQELLRVLKPELELPGRAGLERLCPVATAENDREKLKVEILHIRTRREELDHAVREAELTLSRERAQLAQERDNVDHLRQVGGQQSETIRKESLSTDRPALPQRAREKLMQLHP